MSTVSSVELEEVARRLAQTRFDDYAADGLGRAYEEFVGRRRRGVGSLALTVDGRAYPNFFAVLADPQAKFATGEVRLDQPPASAADWEFLSPVEKVVFHDDGSAELLGPGGMPPRRGIARVLVREHFLVRSRADDTAATPRRRMPNLVGTTEQGVAICRALSLLPFEVALVFYVAEERLRFEVNLVHSELLRDPRAGRLAASRRVRRSARLGWGLDRTLGRGHVSLLASRCLEVVFESNGLTSVDLAHIFGGGRELVESALQALVQQRLVAFDARTGVYRAHLESFLPPSETTAPAAPALVRPELRSSVQELLAAAEARAVCPMCGLRVATPPSYLLCDECAGQVGLT